MGMSARIDRRQTRMWALILGFALSAYDLADGRANSNDSGGLPVTMCGHEPKACGAMEQLFSERQGWREAYLYPQLDQCCRSALCVRQMPRVCCRAQQWLQGHDLAGTSF